jgi:hypothetical protein
VDPMLKILPRFASPEGQWVPFYGLLHPTLPMFSLSECRRSGTVGRSHWWRLGPSDRYKAQTPVRACLDDAGRVQELRVYGGEPNKDDSNVLEKWSFRDWHQHGSVEFPNAIDGTWYIFPPTTTNESSRSIPSKRMRLTLTALHVRRPPDSLFSIWVPSVGTGVDDARYEPRRRYVYGDRSKRLDSGMPQDASRRVAGVAGIMVGMAVVHILRSRLRSSGSAL